MKHANWNIGKIILGFLLVFVFISIGLRIFFLSRPALDTKKLSLEGDGIVLMPEFLSTEDKTIIEGYIKNNNVKAAKLHIMNSSSMRDKIQKQVGADYVFNDYIFLIKKSQFHTCHRDYNGDFFNEGQKHPSYTIIIYLEDMKKCLDIIPKSHVQKGSYNFNLTDYTQTVTCKNRDAFLFNANLIHNGSINEQENHMRIQMKISHKEDKKTLYFYNDYNKMLTEDNHSPAFFQYAQKHASCQFPFVGEVLKKYDHNDGTDSSKSRSLFYAKLEDVP